jgi:hypothetical protein
MSGWPIAASSAATTASKGFADTTLILSTTTVRIVICSDLPGGSLIDACLTY